MKTRFSQPAEHNWGLGTPDSQSVYTHPAMNESQLGQRKLERYRKTNKPAAGPRGLDIALVHGGAHQDALRIGPEKRAHVAPYGWLAGLVRRGIPVLITQKSLGVPATCVGAAAAGYVATVGGAAKSCGPQGLCRLLARRRHLHLAPHRSSRRVPCDTQTGPRRRGSGACCALFVMVFSHLHLKILGNSYVVTSLVRTGTIGQAPADRRQEGG